MMKFINIKRLGTQSLVMNNHDLEALVTCAQGVFTQIRICCPKSLSLDAQLFSDSWAFFLLTSSEFSSNRKKEEIMLQVKYNYIVVRDDLPTEQQIVQSSHAAYEAGTHLEENSSSVNHLIVLSVPNEHALLETYKKLEQRTIRSILFREPDISNQATALCTEPIYGSRRKFFSKYSLWRKGK